MCVCVCVCVCVCTCVHVHTCIIACCSSYPHFFPFFTGYDKVIISQLNGGCHSFGKLILALAVNNARLANITVSCEIIHAFTSSHVYGRGSSSPRIMTMMQYIYLYCKCYNHKILIATKVLISSKP